MLPQVWYTNVPHTKLVKIKGHQNWVKVSGEYLTFPGGGTQFKHGALHYIEFIEQVSLHIAFDQYYLSLFLSLEHNFLFISISFIIVMYVLAFIICKSRSIMILSWRIFYACGLEHCFRQ